jgi:hypothetical protein
MVAKRDRLIMAMHGEGVSDAAIAQELGVSRPLVSERVQNYVRERTAGISDTVARAEPPAVEWPDTEEPEEAPPPPAWPEILQVENPASPARPAWAKLALMPNPPNPAPLGRKFYRRKIRQARRPA